jgi:signal transduction histidine kinase
MQIAARPEADISPFPREGSGQPGGMPTGTAIIEAHSDASDSAEAPKKSRSRSLQLNFLAITLSSVSIILLVFFCYLESSHHQNASNQIDQKIIRMIDGSSILLADATKRKNSDEILLLLAPILGDPDVVSVAVTLMDGTRLAEHGNPLDDLETYMVFRRAISHVVNGEPTQIAWVHVGITHQRIHAELEARLWTDIALAGLILVAIVISSFQSLRITVMQPLRKLLSAIEGWEVDDDHRPVSYRRNDEFGQLITAFNQLQRRQQYYQDSLRAALDTAENADQVKTAFLAIIGHELRTPLNAIIGFSDLIAQQMGEAESARYGEYIGHINDSGNALLDMINDILEITHVQAGKLKLVEEPLLLRSLVDISVEQCLARVDGNSPEITNAVPESLPQIYTDPVRLGRMVFHLISNSIRFTPAGGKIRIEAVVDDDGLHLTVSDTGCGIPEDRLLDLQQPFSQLSNDWTHHGAGAGLGLTYVRQMAERLGGEISLESIVDEGTTVTVRLPSGTKPPI